MVLNHHTSIIYDEGCKLCLRRDETRDYDRLRFSMHMNAPDEIITHCTRKFFSKFKTHVFSIDMICSVAFFY